MKDDDPSAFRMPPPRGAVHSAEIEYAMGTLDTNPVYAWTEDDYAVSKTMQAYFANFVKTGDPNGPGLPKWPAAGSGKDDHSMFMQLDVDARAVPDRYRVGLHGKNLGDEEYRIGGYNFPGGLFANSVNAFYGPPRTVTLSVEAKF